MKKILLAAVVAAVGASSASAAGPADVTVRVEGTNDTLLARSAVHTTTTPVVKDGNPDHSCTGTSVAGALEVGTAGNWSGTWSDGLGYSVEVILGEAHSFSSDHYWGEFVNGAPGNGACADELSAGDEVLFAPEPTDFSAAPDNPMYLSVPGTAQRGAPFNVTVSEKVTTFDSSPPFAAHTASRPVQGASVGGATTDSNGVAALTLDATGNVGLRATHAGNIRTATETVCVHDGDDGSCGTTKPGAPAAQCIHDGDDGLCGTPDHKATYGFITSIKEHQHFRKGHGPRNLKGTSDPDPSGLKDVQLRLTRNDRGRCARFSGTLLRFAHVKRCGARRGMWFSIGSKADWSYLLPKALGRGRYVLDLKTIDGAGNEDAKLARTRNRVVFFVGQ